MGLDLRSSQIEHDFIKERIKDTEKQFADISSKLSSYNKHLSGLKDSGYEVANCILSFASKETCNQTLRLTLGKFSDVLKSIQEFRDAEVHRIQVKVILGLNNYHHLCTDARTEMKKCFDARAKELKKKNDLEKARSKHPTNLRKITQAEKEVNQAKEEATRMAQAMGKHVERFERRKLEDLKQMFLEFVKIELMFHAKAIELYTSSFNILKEINVEDDLHEFTSHLKAKSSTLDAEALSPVNHDTIPKVVEANAEPSTYISYKSPPLNPRSVFTIRATSTVNSNSSSEVFAESNYESGDQK